MSVLPDRVSHGGTYAGNRVAAAAAVRVLTILRETDALATIAATGQRLQAGLRDVLDRVASPYAFTGHPTMFGIVFAGGTGRLSRLGGHRSRPLRRGGLADDPARRDARAGLARALVPVESHAAGDTVDRVVGIFADALAAALEARA